MTTRETGIAAMATREISETVFKRLYVMLYI